MKKNQTSKYKSKRNNKGFITIEALLVITLLLVFAFFILNKLLFKLKFVGNDLLSDMDDTFALDTSNAGNGGLGGNNGSGGGSNIGNGGDGGIDGEGGIGGGSEFPVVPPITTNTMLDIYYDDGKQAWTNQDISILVKTNHSDVTTIMLPTGNVSKDEAKLVVKENGPYRIGAKDKYGKEVFEDIRVTKIDKVPPLMETTNEGTKDNPKIRVTVSDALSGVDRIVLPDGELVFNINSVVYPINKNGSYIFRVFDKAGNMVAKTIDILDLDDIAPVISIKKEMISDNKKVLITATAKDDGSGVDRMVLPDGTVLRTDTVTYTVSENGRYTFKAYDRKGNMGQFHVNIVEIIEIKDRDIINIGISLDKDVFLYDKKNNETFYRGKTKIGKIFVENYNMSVDSYDEFVKLKDPIYKDIKKIFTNNNSIYLLKNNGSLYAKGSNTYGEFGLGHKNIEYNFIKLPIDNIIDFEITQGGLIAINESGQVFVAGENINGELGIDTVKSTMNFTIVTKIPKIKKVFTRIDYRKSQPLTLLLTEDSDLLISGGLGSGIEMKGYPNETKLYNFEKYNYIDKVENVFMSKYINSYNDAGTTYGVSLFKEAKTKAVFGINTTVSAIYAENTRKKFDVFNYEDVVEKFTIGYSINDFQLTLLSNGKIIDKNGNDLNQNRNSKEKYVDIIQNAQFSVILKQANGEYYDYPNKKYIEFIE